MSKRKKKDNRKDIEKEFDEALDKETQRRIGVKASSIPATTAELTHFATAFKQYVESVLGNKKKAKTKSFSPVVIVTTRETEVSDGGNLVFVVESSFNTQQQKQEILRGMGEQIFRHKAIPSAALLASEAWIVKGSKDEVDMTIPPSQNPKREEVIVITGMSFGERADTPTVMTSCPLLRDSEDYITGLGEWDEMLTDGMKHSLITYIWEGFVRSAMVNLKEKLKGERPPDLWTFGPDPEDN